MFNVASSLCVWKKNNSINQYNYGKKKIGLFFGGKNIYPTPKLRELFFENKTL